MATFTQFKQNPRVKQVLYRHPGNGASIRMPKRAFVGEPPATLEVVDPEGGWAVGSGRIGRSSLPPDIAAAAKTLAEFRAKEKADRIAKMTPAEKAEYDRKAKERNDRLAKARETMKAKSGGGPKPVAKAAGNKR